MPHFRGLAQAHLEALVREPGVRGALLVSRDGLPVLTAGRIGEASMLSAMSATMLGAAEIAMAGSSPVRLRVNANGLRVHAVPATRDTLLIMVGDSAFDAESQAHLATAAADALAAATTRTLPRPQNARENWVQEPPSRPAS